MRTGLALGGPPVPHLLPGALRALCLGRRKTRRCWGIHKIARHTAKCRSVRVVPRLLRACCGARCGRTPRRHRRSVRWFVGDARWPPAPTATPPDSLPDSPMSTPRPAHAPTPTDADGAPPPATWLDCAPPIGAVASPTNSWLYIPLLHAALGALTARAMELHRVQGLLRDGEAIFALGRSVRGTMACGHARGAHHEAGARPHAFGPAAQASPHHARLAAEKGLTFCATTSRPATGFVLERAWVQVAREAVGPDVPQRRPPTVARQHHGAGGCSRRPPKA